MKIAYHREMGKGIIQAARIIPIITSFGGEKVSQLFQRCTTVSPGAGNTEVLLANLKPFTFPKNEFVYLFLWKVKMQLLPGCPNIKELQEQPVKEKNFLFP